jgi:hypothetical protein
MQIEIDTYKIDTWQRLRRHDLVGGLEVCIRPLMISRTGGDYQCLPIVRHKRIDLSRRQSQRPVLEVRAPLQLHMMAPSSLLPHWGSDLQLL